MKLRYLLLPLPLLLIGYLLQGPDGRALLQHSGLPDPLPASTRHEFYKWQDAQGHWNYSDRQPEGVAVQVVTVDTAANLLPPPPRPLSETREMTDASATPADSAPIDTGSLTTPTEARDQADHYFRRLQRQASNP